MKYEKDIDNLLKDLIYQDWMNDSDYNEVLSEIFKELNITKEKLCLDIEVGVNNGYSIDQQFVIIKKIFKTII